MLDIIEEYASVCKANPLNKQKETKTIIPGQKINVNGYEYVDLGLPSGTLWATCNVGASKPSDYGMYFQWGDIIGYSKEQVGKDKQFSESCYKWSINGSHSNFNKYIDLCSTLDLEDDAAHINMKGDWHMPTPNQIQELIDYTKSVLTIQDDVMGMKFASKNGKSIFIPMAGEAWEGKVDDIGIYGYIWASAVSPIRNFYAQYLYFDVWEPKLYFGSNRCIGYPIRGVIG